MAIERVPGLLTEVLYDGVDIRAQIDPWLLELTFVDHLEGTEPDAIEVKVEDRQRLFQGPLYARKGAALGFAFGLEGGAVFESRQGYLIDEINVDGPPDVVTWRAIGQVPSGALHTRVSRAWTGTTLTELAQAVGRQHGLEVVVEAERVQLRYVCQQDESDLAFLKRLAEDYGLILQLRGSKSGGKPLVVITGLDRLMTRPPVFEVPRREVTRFRFRDKTTPGAAGAYTRYFDSSLKELVEIEVAEEPVLGRDRITRQPAAALRGRGHKLRTVRRQAPEVHVRRALKSPAGFEHEATLTLPGNPLVRSGVTLQLPVEGEEGWAVNGGLWLAVHSRHTLEVGSGYTTEVTIRRQRR